MNDIKIVNANIPANIDRAIENGTLKTSDWLISELQNPNPWYKEIYWFIRRQVRKIKDTYYEVKYAFQRMFRDYDDPDVFNLDLEFLDRYTKVLKRFRKKLYGYPDEVGTYDDWLRIIDEMISYFELSNEWSNYYCDDYFEYEYLNSRYNEQLAYYYRHKALDMFVKYFDGLWN